MAIQNIHHDSTNHRLKDLTLCLKKFIEDFRVSYLKDALISSKPLASRTDFCFAAKRCLPMLAPKTPESFYQLIK